MKVIKGIFIAILLLFMIIMGIAAPLAFIGTAIFLIGLFLSNQKKKGNVILKKPGYVTTAGFILFLVLGASTADTSETTAKNDKETKVADTTSVSEEEANKEAEEEANAKADAEKVEKEKLETAEKENEELASKFGLELVTVGRIVDGDTFETSDGRKVRLVGVNTPESTTRTEEYGKEASNYTKSMLEGKQVWLQKDVSDKDRYNRYLRIIWLELPTDDTDENEIRTKMFNADLVLNGYAEPSTYPPDVKYSDYFVAFAREARDQDKGLWAFGENGTTKGDLDSETNNSGSNSSSNSESSNNDTSAVTPPAGSKESFKNCTELRKVYPDGVASDHPAYDSKHDRDKDNYACER